MLDTITNTLKESEIKKIKNEWEVSVTLSDHVINQPTIQGGTSLKLSSLAELADKYSFSQLPINPTKVKTILLKSDTGLVKTGFMLFAPITVASTTDNPDNYSVVSGRHRISALLTICEIVGLNPDEVSVIVQSLVYDNEEQLALSIAAFNTNRTMTGTERELVTLTAKYGGEAPNIYNAEGNTGTKNACKKHFKQVATQQALDANADEEEHKEILTHNNLGRVFGYIFDFLCDDAPDYYKQLKSGSSDAWSCVESLAIHLYDTGYLNQPSGNVSRMNAAQYKELALSAYSDYVRSLSGNETKQEDDDNDTAF